MTRTNNKSHSAVESKRIISSCNEEAEHEMDDNDMCDDVVHCFVVTYEIKCSSISYVNVNSITKERY